MAFKILIIDDEEKSIEVLRWKLSQTDFNDNIEIIEFLEGKKALQYVKYESFDLVFLDINMPHIDGLEMAGFVKEFKPYAAVIFVTGHDEYHLEALRLSALDYIQKPIHLEALNEALNRFQIYRKGLVYKNNLSSERVAIHLIDGISYLDKKDIYYCSSESNYSYIHLIDGRKILTSKTLKHHENILGDGFFRIHHQYLINLTSVVKYLKGSGGSVELMDGTILPVSRRKKDELLALLGK